MTADKTYYCRTDKKFVTDLDVPNSQIDDTALINKNKATCEKAGFTWTGTKCCSEADDTNEYYNDLNGIGGCWNSKPVISISFVEGTDDSVVNGNGQFHGCEIDKTNYNKANDNLLNIVDLHAGVSLIKNDNYCSNDPEKNYYCSFTEKWLPTDFADRTHFSLAPVQNPKQLGECCAQVQCWDGQACVENQANKPLVQPIEGFRCINGQWTTAEPKLSPDETIAGFCPKPTQCLVNVFASKDQCIDSGQYTGDNYCENGNWSSRTKLLALKLLKLKTGDYTLFCDSRENTLNNLKYLTESKELVANVLTNIQTNNFCILKTANKVVAATSINKDVETIGSSLDIFGVTSCNDALIDDSQYHPCDNTNRVWYNKNLKSLIYSVTPITIPAEADQLGSFEEFILNPIKSIIAAIK
ncbi:MAG: hypothetical protein AAB975_04095, partial [Patescibacteria group bacterium]